MLDKVIFVVRTQKEDDLLYLDELLRTETRYSKKLVVFDHSDYSDAYSMVEDRTLYIKIDDDIIFIEDSAIPAIVQTLTAHPEYLMVSANVINQPSLSWVHRQLGAVKPWLPEFDESKHVPFVLGESSWRASALPLWAGPADFKLDETFFPIFSGHSWLPMPKGSHLENTPIRMAGYDPHSPGLYYWTLAAQQHYSFLEHLENNELWRYKFHLWDYNYMRMGFQFVGMWGKDILAAMPIGKDDEGFFTEVVTKKLRRRAVVDGRGMVAHYSFVGQKDHLDQTDLLLRYHSFALENICPR